LTRRPLISLIIPIHNEEEYLPESLKSLKEIEDQFFELLFILDRCTANSESIVMQWFPDARTVKKESGKWKNSLAENFRLGLEASKGNIICTQDADATAPHDLGPLLGRLQGDVASARA
jgi:glycosyltransferase involved in cell wall biosynthesis